jgi:hypothetical protein
MSNSSVVVSYKFSAGSAILLVVVCLGVMAAMAWLAQSHRALSILGVITLPPAQAAVFFWVFCVACILPTVLAFRFAAAAFGPPRMIELNETEAILPKASVSMKLMSQPYRSIRKVQIRVVGKQHMAIIQSAVGESRLMSSGFANQRQFEAFVQELSDRVKRG